jgi:phosphotransferase system HPr (HPr) family protein
MSATVYRVDPRLVHATLMNAWVPAVGAQQIVVVDNDVASDPRAKNILTMSAMDVPVLFVRESEAKVLKEAYDPAPRIVLFASLERAERAHTAGLTMRELIVGHLPEGTGRFAVLPAVHLGPEDRATIKRLERKGVTVFIQPLPRDEKIRVHDIEGLATSAAPPVRAVSKVEIQPTPTKLGRVHAKLRVINERGLHLRAAHALAHLVANLPENVQVSNGPDFVNAKSLLGLTTLGATCGTVLELVITGPDPQAAFAKIKSLFETGFDEGVKPGMSVEVDA